MKKKLFLLATAALLVVAAIIGGSLAADSASGQKATSDLAAPTLQVAIGQSSASELTVSTNGKLMPGDSLKDAGFTIANTANVPLYARVTVTKYWTDQNGAKNNTTMDASLIQMSAAAGSWLQAEDVMTGTSNETEVYFYAIPLQPGQTADLNLSLALDKDLTNAYQSAGVKLDATVDAVQFVSGQNKLNADGILASFGVVATLNGDGSIAAVTQ